MTDKKRKHFKLKFRHFVIFTLVSILLLFVVFRLQLKSHLNAEYVRIRSEGYPVTLEEWDASYSIPAGEKNAADLIDQALMKQVTWTVEKAESLPVSGSLSFNVRTGTLTDEQLVLLGEYIEQNREFLETLHRLRDYEYARYDVDLSRSISPDVTRLGSIRRSAQTLIEESIYYTSTGDFTKAVSSTETLFALARTLSNEPVLISYLTKIPLDLFAIDSLERTLCCFEPSVEVLTALNEDILQAIERDSFAAAMAGERCSILDYFGKGKAVESFLPPKWQWLKVPYSLTGWQDLDEARLIKASDLYIKAAKSNMSIRKNALDDARAYSDTLGYSAPTSAVAMASVHRISMFHLNLLARLHAARTAIAIERYRLDRGRLPNRLYELVPSYLDKIPPDPFDGGKLKYIVKENGYVVYSVGEDGTDNGGTERTSSRTDFDITFTVEKLR